MSNLVLFMAPVLAYLVAKSGSDLHVGFGTLLLILVVLAIIVLLYWVLSIRRRG